ncbi:MAG: FkbM family methyltransferase [Rubrivivax sp.]|nr:FkbM family methyltransferase [Rubrivivax sp.]
MNATEALKSVVFRSAWLTGALRRLRVLAHHARGRPHEADFNFLRDPAFASGLLLDLGANIGQSALSVAAVQPGLQIHSIEANPACEPGLKTTAWLLGARFGYRLVGVGAQAGRLGFHVPVRASRMLLEEGTFDAATLVSANSVARIGMAGRDYTLQVISVPLVTVDSLALAPRVVKMDLQGLELAALAGMVQTIERCHPVFMIEIGEQQDRIVDFLAGHGYARWHWNGRQLCPGVRADTLNAIFMVSSDPARPAA